MQFIRKTVSKNLIFSGTVIIIVFMAVTTAAKAIANNRTTERDGYKTIRDVPGIEFQVNKEFSDYSTAVLEISKNIDFLDYQTYSYKNGTDTYLLFNMNSYIIIAKKGTDFDFPNMGVEESLSVNSVDGIWFSLSGKNPIKESSEDRYILSVTAQVVITPLVYNDFQGTLTVVRKDGDEWTLFAGTAARADDVCKESIGYTANTIFPVEAREPIETKNAIVAVENEMGSAGYTEEDSHVDADNLSGEETHTDEQSQEEEIFYIRESQIRQDLEKGKVYESDPYSMLKTGNAGIAATMNEQGGGYTEVYIRVDQLYSKEETAGLIKEYISSGQSYYAEMEAPEGTHFEAVSYSVRYLDLVPSYVNIKLCGLDGEDLRFRGVIYPQKTYNIFDTVTNADGWESGNICFYAIPNGCLEYALYCGPGIDREDLHSAYFYMRTDK